MALEGRNPQILAEAELEVNHAVVARKALPFEQYTSILSHPVPLRKHRKFLSETFTQANLKESADPGASARDLAEAKLSDQVLVIAMPSVCEKFGLTAVIDYLPANDGYLSRFLLLRSV